MATVTTQLQPAVLASNGHADSPFLWSKSSLANPPDTSFSLVPLPPAREPVSEVLDKDKGTPDNHVTRDSRLIRLTGVHPFNAEAPLTDLYREGRHSR